jgi:hypothetical protein
VISASADTTHTGSKLIDQCNYDKRITPRRHLVMTVDTREKVGIFHLVEERYHKESQDSPFACTSAQLRKGSGHNELQTVPG